MSRDPTEKKGKSHNFYYNVTEDRRLQRFLSSRQ